MISNTKGFHSLLKLLRSTFSTVAVVDGPLGGLSDGEDVHTVDVDSGDVVAPGVESSRRSRSVLGGSHAIAIVLADEHDYKDH